MASILEALLFKMEALGTSDEKTPREENAMANEDQSRSLTTFLLGTIDLVNSPVSLLRGHTDVLRSIWMFVCEEWWEAHIERFYGENIPQLLGTFDRNANYPRERTGCAGCPCAIVEKGIVFPGLYQFGGASYAKELFSENGDGKHLYVNMMPIDMDLVRKGPEELPEGCRQYYEIVMACFDYLKLPASHIGYLTIDERPVSSPGSSQRRGGLHTESPGVLPVPISPNKASSADTAYDWGRHHRTVRGGTFVPGAEHHWGGGLMMRHEVIDGGIFMVSNVANTTAVWNMHVNDPSGNVIGPHGDIERCRGLLGPPTRLLEAGEMIWMTDKTPHESLPVLNGERRQYFRLVVGEVSAWFEDHSTKNPLGVVPDPKVTRVVTGNKFQIFPKELLKCKWGCGTYAAMKKLRDQMDLRKLLFYHGIGHMAERLVKWGIESVYELYWSRTAEPKAGNSSWLGEGRLSDGLTKEMHYAGRYYEHKRLRSLVELLHHALTNRYSEDYQQHSLPYRNPEWSYDAVQRWLPEIGGIARLKSRIGSWKEEEKINDIKRVISNAKPSSLKYSWTIKSFDEFIARRWIFKTDLNRARITPSQLRERLAKHYTRIGKR